MKNINIKKMKKYINLKSMIFASLLAITAISCDAEQDVSPIASPDGYPVVSFSIGETTVSEGGSPIIEIIATTDKKIDREISFSIDVLGGTATLHDDYDIEVAGLAPYQNETRFLVMIHEDAAIEGDETIELQVNMPSLASKYLVNPSTVLPSYSITIQNYVGNTLDMEFAWDYTIDGYSTTNNIDFDIYVADAAGYDNNDPWATVNETDYAATGNHPEKFSFNFDDWADGEYILFHDLWYNAFYGYGPADMSLPLVATFTRPGLFQTSLTQDSSQSINGKTTNGFVDDDDNDTGEWNNGFIAKVKIANGTYTVSDYKGAELVSGKSSKVRTPRPSNIRK